MPERYCQLEFDEKVYSIVVSKDDIPREFAGQEFDQGEDLSGRFVRAARERVSITTPKEAGEYLLEKVYTPFGDFDQEEMWLLLLNTKNQVTHEVMVYRGTVNTTYIRRAELFKEAIKVNASALLLSHCHPSGDPTPSPEDVKTTAAINQIADLLDIALVDHIIVGKDRWVSLRERGLGFK